MRWTAALIVLTIIVPEAWGQGRSRGGGARGGFSRGRSGGSFRGHSGGMSRGYSGRSFAGRGYSGRSLAGRSYSGRGYSGRSYASRSAGGLRSSSGRSPGGTRVYRSSRSTGGTAGRTTATRSLRPSSSRTTSARSSSGRRQMSTQEYLRRTYGQTGRRSAVGSSTAAGSRSSSVPRNGFYRGRSATRASAVGRSNRTQPSGRSAAAASQGRARGAATGRNVAAGSTAARRGNRSNGQGFVRGSHASRTSRHATAGATRRTAGVYRGRPYRSHYNYHGYYCGSGWRVSFHFGWGSYWGWRCYWPYYNYYGGCHWGFFYPWPVTYCYVPFGFYWGGAPVYVTRYVYVKEETPQYEVVEQDEEPAQDAEGKVVDPKPAAGSPVTEKYLREASELFQQGKYLEAAKKFRLAAISSPDSAAPHFALGQALIALGSYEYAAKVLRKALRLNPDLVREPGDIVGVYPSQDEFDRVMVDLEQAAGESVDARFLVGVQRYFSGDPRARASFAALGAELPDDELVKAFRDAVEKRFKAEAELPPVKAPEKAPQ